MNVWFRRSLSTCLIGSIWGIFLPKSWAVPLPDVSESREIVRRKHHLLCAKKLLLQGERAMEIRNYAEAYNTYLEALSSIPQAPAVTQLRRKIIDRFSVSSIFYAKQLIQKGCYSDAEKVIKTILCYNPQYSSATRLLLQLQNPQYFNKTITPDFAGDQNQIAHLLGEAEGFHSTGRFDLAQQKYEQILNIDPYHIGARQGEKRLHESKHKYYQHAFQEGRATFLKDVTNSWTRPPAANERTEVLSNLEAQGSDEIRTKLNKILLPKVEFRNATVCEVIDFLKQRAKELDPSPTGKGINIILKLANQKNENERSLIQAENSGENLPPRFFNPKIDLNLTHIPLYEALRYVSELAGLKLKVDPYAVSISPLTDSEDQFLTKEYRILPSFLPTKIEESESLPTFDSSHEKKKTWIRMGAQEYLQSQGVYFPQGASAHYVPAGSRLIVRNTADALNLIDSIVAAAHGAVPLQVQIEAKFINISQNNLKEMGFDWMLGPIALPSNLAVSGGGPDFFPTIQTGLPMQGNLVTSNLRSGNSSSLAHKSIHSLITQTAQLESGGSSILGISGIFTRPQFQMVIQALSQTKGVDLLSAPKITTRSGQKATIKMVRAFPYPTEFQPPKIPQKGIVAAKEVLGNNAFVSQTVTPTTPTRFEVRNIGVSMEVEPVVGTDGLTIDLNLSPEIVEFEGFVNYGVPILGIVNQAVTGIPVPTVLTENNIQQPIFSTRKVTTSVTIWDGQTVALGGLMREDVQKVRDKIPLLGDIPGVGRLFQFNSDQKIKENLIIFVTARLIDTQGRPVRSDDEREEILRHSEILKDWSHSAMSSDN